MTLLGTNAPRSAVTQGKPSFFGFFFPRFQGSFSLSFVLFGTSFSTSLVCPFWFLVWFDNFLVCCFALWLPFKQVL